MRRTLWLMLVAFLVNTGTVIGFEVGGRTGFNEGFRAASNLSDEITAAEVITTLKVLGKGNSDRAQDFLESTLDTSIVGLSANSRFSPTLESFVFFVEPSLRHAPISAPMLHRIAAYRQSHPYENPNAKWAVDWLLAQYGTPPQEQQLPTESSEERSHEVH